MTSVEIEYCVPCGHLDRAQDLQRAILSEFGLEVDSVSLKTGDGGVFKVRTDGDVVFDKSEEAFDKDEIVDRVRGEVSATA
ncbi:MAG: Rdx family protein [Halobacteriales archaeon]|nr:Rdx family protein [Halobacteriales archaeon]